jgi:hypothetical protein
MFYELLPRIPGDLFGMKVIESPSRARYTLPPELLPGIPWPPGFREDFNSWSVSFLGTVNVLPHGQVYMRNGSIAIMRPEDIVKLSSIF